MSTKIYNAWVTKTFTMRELLRICRAVRLEAIRARNKFIISSGFKEDYLPLLRDRALKVKNTGFRDPFADYSFEATFFPSGNRLAFVIYCEHEFLRKLLVNALDAKDWHYQNSTDRPDGISWREWRTRQNFWDKALPGAGVPSENGFSFTFLGYDIPYDLKFPPKEKYRAV